MTEERTIRQQVRHKSQNGRIVRCAVMSILHRKSTQNVGARVTLGPLEAEVMDALWVSGECGVKEVVRQLARQPAYTTVMSTLVRLYRKGLLSRRKNKRGFLYSPLLTPQQMTMKVAQEFVANFLVGPREKRAALLSSLLIAIVEHDAILFDEVEKKILETRSFLRQSLTRVVGERS